MFATAVPYHLLEFDIPAGAVMKGTLNLSVFREPPKGGAEGCNAVAEIWLVRR